MVVRYRIQDATADVDREVEGRIVVTVQGRPETPGTPSVSSVQDRTVVLSWTPPADNGAAITGYTVSSTRGDYVKQCAATTCTLDGLTNNVEYNFTVIATNRVGDSDPSAPSETRATRRAPRHPGAADADVRRPEPERRVGDADDPRIAGGVLHPRDLAGAAVGHRAEDRRDRQLDGVGRARERRRVPGARAGAQPRARPVQLERVVRHRDPRACSRAAGCAERGATAAGGRPGAAAGLMGSSPRPTAPTSPGYELQVLQGGTAVRTIPNIPAGQLSQAVSLTTSTTDYTFRVRASNKAGWSDWGATSSPRRAFGVPGAPSGVSAAPGDRSLTVSYSPAAGNGATGGELRYEYSLNGGGWAALPGNNVIARPQQRHELRGRAACVHRARRRALRRARLGAVGGADPVRPGGHPGASANRSGRDITFGWSAPAPNGRAITQVQISIDGGGGRTWRTAARATNTYAYSTTTRSMCVRGMPRVSGARQGRRRRERWIRRRRPRMGGHRERLAVSWT